MSDLVIDYDTLHEASTSFKGISDEFNNLGQTESDLGGVWGSGDIKHAMGDFAGNWDYHRKKIQSAMDDLGKLLEKAETGFRELDTKLKKELSSDGGKH